MERRSILIVRQRGVFWMRRTCAHATYGDIVCPCAPVVMSSISSMWHVHAKQCAGGLVDYVDVYPRLYRDFEAGTLTWVWA